MAISPPSDIVLEVVNAAGPASRAEAAGKLARLGGTAASARADFEDVMNQVQPRPAPAPQMPFDPALALVTRRNGDALAAQPASPFEQFEAFALQNFIQSMLPKESAALFGGGTAGGIWKSMLADGLAKQLASAGGIGIAETLANAGAKSSGAASNPDVGFTAAGAPDTSSSGRPTSRGSSGRSGSGGNVLGPATPISGEVGQARESLAMVESSGNYQAIGPVVKEGMYKGDRAYGRYQVMGKNIPAWTKEVLGESMNPREFLANEKAQDAVVEYQLQKSYDKYGTWEDAASVWFSGRPVKSAGNASDGYNTVPEYVSKFRDYMNA